MEVLGARSSSPSFLPCARRNVGARLPEMGRQGQVCVRAKKRKVGGGGGEDSSCLTVAGPRRARSYQNISLSEESENIQHRKVAVIYL